MFKYMILGFAIFLTVSADVKCPQDEDENSMATYYPHEGDCWKFYECDHGDLALLECSPGLYWDTRLNVCDRDVDCGSLATTPGGPTEPNSVN